jgi:20S proteasome alpha/beta subunit
LTIVVGFCCSEGIVIASDSQISLGATRRWEQKVWAVESSGIVFGLSGTESTMHLLRDFLANASFNVATPALVRDKLAKAADHVLKPEYQRVRALLPPSQSGFDNMPTADAIVGVYAKGEPHLFQLYVDGIVTDHHQRGFAATGTGAGFAEHASQIFRDLRTNMTLHQAKMLAFRVIQDAIAAAGPQIAVGGKVQMATLRGGAPKPQCELLEWDDPTVKDAVDGWVALEAVRFKEHVPPGESIEPTRTPAES